MIRQFFRTHRAIYVERDHVYRAAAGEACGLSSPWLILFVGALILGGLDLWLFGGAPLLDDRISPWLPWNVLLPQVAIWLVGGAMIVGVMTIFRTTARPIEIARLWAYAMGHVATIVPPILVAVLSLRALLFSQSVFELPTALIMLAVSFCVVLWLTAGLRNLGHRMVPAVIAVALSFAAGAAIINAKRTWVARFYDVQSGSMRPGFDRGDRLLISRALLMTREPRPGDIVVYNIKVERSDDVEERVHRIIGGPGDRVRFSECGAIVNGQSLKTAGPSRSLAVGIRIPVWLMPESLRDKAFLTTFDDSHDALCQRAEITVPPGHFFIVGDARDRSIDSRMPWIGLVRRDAITGIVVFVYVAAGKSHRL